MGKMERVLSRHKDNPTLWDHEKEEWTDRGTEFLDNLRATTGARYSRMYLGEWVSEEGQIWEMFDRARHVIKAKAEWQGDDDNP